MRYLPVLFLLLLSALAVPAVGADTDPPATSGIEPVIIRGFIVDPAGTPVAGVRVEVVETGQFVRADSRGRFEIRVLPGKPLTLRAQNNDYEAVLAGPYILPLETDEPVKVQFQQLRTFETTVVVTGTRSENLLKDVPVRTEVISAEVIERKGATTLADALDGATGLRVENNCQNCGFNQLRINGLQGAYSHILVNGMNAFSSMASVYGLEQIPAVIVDRIEVVKGGGSALYGAGAVGGVVNVLTREPLRTSFSLEGSGVSTDGSPEAGFRGLATWVSESGRQSVLAYGNIDHAKEYDRNGDGFSELSRRRLQNGGAQFYQRLLDDSAELRLGVEFGHEWRRGGDRIDLKPEETEVTEWAETYRRGITLDWNHALTGHSYYRLQIAYTDMQRDTYYGGGYDANAYGDTDNPHLTGALTVHHDIAGHELTGGIQYEQDEIDDRHPGYDWFLHQQYDVWGGYIQDEFALTGFASLLVGIRHDNHSALRDGVTSPRVSLMLSPNDSLRLRATYGGGFKAPVVFDEDLHILISAGEPQLIFNDPDLREERVRSWSLSAEYSVSRTAFALRLESNLFHNRLQDTFVLEGVEDDLNSHVFRRINGGSSEIYGVEGNLDVTFTGGAALQGGITLQRALLDTPEPEFGALDFFRTPEVYGQLGMRLPVDAWAVSATMRYTGPMVVPHYAGWIADDRLEETDSFLVFDSRVEYAWALQPGTATIFLNLENLTDSFQDDFDLGPARDSGYIYGPRVPRTFTLGFKYAY